MKTLSETIKLIVLAAIGIVSILIFHACNKAELVDQNPAATPSPMKFELSISKTTPVTDLGQFTALLNKNCKPNGADDCDVDIHVGDEIKHGPPFKDITTTNIIKSENADSAVEKAKSLSHVSQRIASNKAADLIDVLKTF